MVASGVPLSLTATALSETSYSLVTLARGALARSHLLNSLRPAASWARYRSDLVTTEIDFPTCNWFGSGVNAYRIALELDNRARSVHVWALVEGVSVGVGSDRCRAADAKCYDTQSDRREY